IAKSILYHKDFHIKPVWDGKDMVVLEEILGFIKEDLPNKIQELEESLDVATIKNAMDHKTWFMPAGDSRESLYKSYPAVFDWVRDNGFKMTWRPHIIAF